MTAPSGPILFNSSTGSDTAASGLGPTTAVSGTGGATDGTTTVDLSADSPDLSGVSAGDLLWIDASSGRQFSIIASVDDEADTVTCDDAFSNTEGSLNWGIGGKRATFDDADSRTLFGSSGMKAGWIVETETDQAVSSTAIAFTGDGTTTDAKRVRGASGGIRTITQSAASQAVFSGSNPLRYWKFSNLKFANSNATPGPGFQPDSNLIATFADCVFGDETNDVSYGFTTSGTDVGLDVTFENCVFQHATIDGVLLSTASNNPVRFNRCHFRYNAGRGLDSQGARLDLTQCLFHDNGSDGARLQSLSAFRKIVDCRFYNNVGDGLELTFASLLLSVLHRNVFTENGAFGLNYAGTGDESQLGYYGKNAYGSGSVANTSGKVTGFALASDDLEVTADPYVDAANGDFNINNTAGGGAVLRASTTTSA